MKKRRHNLIPVAMCLILSGFLISCGGDNEGSITTTYGEATSDTSGDTPLDVTPPSIEYTYPADGEINIAPDTEAVVIFSEAMDVSSITISYDNTCSGSIQLSKDDFNSCTPASQDSPLVEMNDTKFTFFPKERLALSSIYKAKFTTQMRDKAGNYFPSTNISQYGFLTADVSSWLMVDGSGPNGRNRDNNRHADFISLTEANGRLYASWEERVLPAAEYQVRVAVFNGDESNPAWNFVEGGNIDYGINYDPINNARFPKGVGFNSKLFMTWSEGSPFQIRVAAFNGSEASPSWDFMEGVVPTVNGLNFDPTRQANNPFLSVAGSKLVVAWDEMNGSSINQIRVAVFNDDEYSPAWNFIDGAGANGINHDVLEIATNPRIIGYQSKLYAIWMEESVVKQIRASVFNPDDPTPSWNSIDGNGVDGMNFNTSIAAWNPCLAVYAEKLYAAWDENGRIRVKVYNGDDANPLWSFIDGGGSDGINYEPSTPANHPGLTILNAKLYATWVEGARTRIAVYNGNDTSPEWHFTEKDVIDADGINFNSTLPSYESHLAVYNSKLFSAWSEENPSNVRQIRIAVGQ